MSGFQRLDLGLLHGKPGGTCFQDHELQATPRNPAAGAAAVAVDQTAVYTNAANQTVYTSGTLGLGANTASKRVGVWINGSSAGGHNGSSVTVAGDACTQVYANGSSSLTVRDELWITTAELVDTSGVVEVTWGGSMSYCMFHVFEILNMPSGTPAIQDSDAQTNGTFAEGARSISLDVLAGGAIIANSFRLAETDAAFSGVTFDVRTNRGESSQSMSTASDEFAAEDLAHAISVTSAYTAKAVSLSP